MQMLPYRGTAMVVRTDFSDDQTWKAIGEAIQEPTPEDFRAGVQLVDDPAYRGMTTARLLEHVPDGPSFLMIVDETTISAPDHPVLVVDLRSEPGREFRATPRAIQSVENNLSIANMFFSEFADAAGADGIFRGF
jgi:hypothetical protein